MNYDKKLLEEKRKYGAVTCSVCKKRNRKDWNIYSANTLCSQKCRQKTIDILCLEASETLIHNTVSL